MTGALKAGGVIKAVFMPTGASPRISNIFGRQGSGGSYTEGRE